jgi:hypothetical protein
VNELAKLRLPIHRFQPWQYQAFGLWLAGLSAEQIAEETGQEASAVKKLIRTPAAKQLLAQIREGTLATVRQAQQDIQLLVPQALAGLREELGLPVGHPVRHKAEMAIIAIGGHTPTQRVLIKHEDDSDDDLKGLSPQQLLDKALEKLSVQRPAIETSATRVNGRDNDRDN